MVSKTLLYDTLEKLGCTRIEVIDSKNANFEFGLFDVSVYKDNDFVNPLRPIEVGASVRTEYSKPVQHSQATANPLGFSIALTMLIKVLRVQEVRLAAEGTFATAANQVFSDLAFFISLIKYLLAIL